MQKQYKSKHWFTTNTAFKQYPKRNQSKKKVRSFFAYMVEGEMFTETRYASLSLSFLLFLRLLSETKKNRLSTLKEKMKWSIEDRLCNINHNPDEDWEQDRQSRIEREIEMEEEEKEWFSVQYPDKEREILMRCPVETCHVPVLTNSKSISISEPGVHKVFFFCLIFV